MPFGPPKRSRKGKQATFQDDSAADETTTLPSGNNGDLESHNKNSQVGGIAGVDLHAASSTTTTEQLPQPAYADLILTSESRRGVYECDYCHTDISQLPRIRCAVCADFDVCLECALVSATMTSVVSSHSARTHGYRVCDSTRYPLFPPVAAASNTNNNGTTTVTAANNGGGLAPPRNLTGAMAAASNLFATAPSAVTTVAEQSEMNKEGEATIDKMDGVEFESSAADSQKKISATALANDPLRPNQSADEAMVPLDEATQSQGDASPQTGATSEASQPALATKSLSRQVSSVSAADETSIAGAAASYNKAGESFNFTDPKIIWTVEEDLRLLEGIRKHGIGNWSDVADAVAGQGSVGKTPKRCMERYLDGFLGRYGCILPPMALEMASSSAAEQENSINAMEQDEAAVAADDGKESEAELSNVDNQEKRSSKRRAAFLRSPSGVGSSSSMRSKKKFRTVPTESMTHFDGLWGRPYLPNSNVQVGQEVGREQAYKAEQVFIRSIASLEKVEEVEKVRQEWEDRVGKPGGPTALPMRVEDLGNLPGSELLGFMPRRGDFDVEYEQDAEATIADMEFIAGEPAADRELKVKVLAIYNSKLDEREKRKRYILSRGLYDYRKKQIEEQKLPRDERDLIHRMRLFERFHTPDEHKIFIADLLRAKRLRKEIAKLQTYRRIGIRTLAEAEQYEVEKARRAFHKNAALQKEAEAARSLSEDKAGTTDGTGKAASETESSYLWKQYRTKQRKERLSLTRSSPNVNQDLTDEANGDGSNDGGDDQDDDDMQVDTETAGEVESDARKIASSDEPKDSETMINVAADPLSTMPGFHLLSSREASLCRKLELTPMQYQDIKQALLTESLSKGLLDNESAISGERSIVKIDVQKRGQVLDFMVTAGWISLKIPE